MKDVEFLPIHENCKGCKKITTDSDVHRCEAYINPTYWWSQGRTCPLRPLGAMSLTDVAKMGVKEGLFASESGMFVYNGRKIASSIGGITQFLKSDKMALIAVKKALGVFDAEPETKVRVGQQKQKKHSRR